MSEQSDRELIAEARKNVDRTSYRLGVDELLARLADALEARLPQPGHDHSGEPKVWCETHQHEHIASIPRFTFECKSCGFGAWHKPTADAHEASLPGHETYEVEHVTRPIRLPQPDDTQVQWLREAIFAHSQRERTYPDGRAGLYYPSIEAAETILRKIAPASRSRLPRVVDREELIGELRRLGMGGGLHEPLRQKVLEEWADHLIAFLTPDSPTREEQ